MTAAQREKQRELENTGSLFGQFFGLSRETSVEGRNRRDLKKKDVRARWSCGKDGGR